MDLNMVTWEQIVLGRRGRIYSRAAGILFHFQVHLEFSRCHLYIATFDSNFILISDYFLILFCFILFCFVLFLTIFTVVSAFHFQANDRQLWKEVEIVCDFGIHGLEHYSFWIKYLWVIALQKLRFWGKSILWLLIMAIVICLCPEACWAAWH